jgi:NAD(P)-dependent dehydrogenase (short-subunit alcohol dehydrogenase family)
MDPLPFLTMRVPVRPTSLQKMAFITGGDSGIGRAVAVLFAKEGADIVIVYFNEHTDARDTQEIITSNITASAC